ncbi:Helix-turn-helix domain-containing protein, partial [Dysosmobacter welbionis]
MLHDQQVFHRGTSLGSNCAQYTTGGRRRPERAEETHGGQAAVRGSRDRGSQGQGGGGIGPGRQLLVQHIE